jgi:protein-S-isoprenylcysteine O-methyltransferase Ste14
MRQIRAIVLLPGTVTLIVPALILWKTDSWSFFGTLSRPLTIVALIAGVSLVVVGAVLWFRTVVLFSRVGKGTLAPWDPPKGLVVCGIYRYVRNPMISGICFVLAGESVLFGSHWLGAVLVIFAAINAVYIPLVEEPGLARRFGEDYETYRRHVPRWIPRLTPWEPPGSLAE